MCGGSGGFFIDVIIHVPVEYLLRFEHIHSCSGAETLASILMLSEKNKQTNKRSGFFVGLHGEKQPLFSGSGLHHLLCPTGVKVKGQQLL